MRIVIDTNVLLVIISKRSPVRWIFDSIISGKIQLCVTTEILLEYREILASKSTDEVAENILSFISSSSPIVFADVFYRFNLIEADDTDNKFVDCAISADADCIISNDKHFQILKNIDFPKVTLLTVEEFVKQY